MQQTNAGFLKTHKTDKQAANAAGIAQKPRRILEQERGKRWKREEKRGYMH